MHSTVVNHRIFLNSKLQSAKTIRDAFKKKKTVLKGIKKCQIKKFIYIIYMHIYVLSISKVIIKRKIN